MLALCAFEAKSHECKTAHEMVKTRTLTQWCRLLIIRQKNDQRASVSPPKGAQQIQDGHRAVLIREPPEDELISCEIKSPISVLPQLHHSNVHIT